jgi:hypothetical protein
MKKKLFILLMIMVVVTTGCATVGGQNEWYTAQKEYALALQAAPQKPLFEMKAIPGTSIQNMESIAVFAPVSTPKELKQFIDSPHPAWGVATAVIKTAGQVAGIYFIKEGVESIFNSFSKIASIPTASYSQSIEGTNNTGQLRTMGDMSTGNIGNDNLVGGLVDQTSVPIVVEPEIVNPVIVP